MGKYQISFVVNGKVSENVKLSHVGTNLKYFLSRQQPDCTNLGFLSVSWEEPILVRDTEASTLLSSQ